MKHPIPSLRSKLRRIILLPMLAVMLILLGVIIFGTMVLRNTIIAQQQLIVHAIARQGTQYLEETGKLIRALAYAMIEFSPEQQQKLLARIRDNYLRFSALYLVDSTGRVVIEHTSTLKLLGLDMSAERFFRAGRDAETFYFSDPFISLATDQITVTMAASIVIEDHFHGMLVGELNLERLQQIIAQVSQGDTNRTFITDRRGKLVAHPEQSWVQEQRNIGNLPLIQSGLHGKDTFEIFYDRDLKEWLFGSVTPMAWGWIVVTTQPLRVAARPLILVAFISLTAYGVSLLIFLWTQVRNLHQFIHPIALLTQQAYRLANEEYDSKPPDTKGAFAEILSLNQSFIHMAEAVTERTNALKIANAALKNELQERQRIEERLRESEEFLHNIVENIPNMIFVKEAQHFRFVRFNKAGETLLGYSRQELIGKNDYDLFPKHEADFFTKCDRDALEQCTVVDIPEEMVRTRDHGVRILHTKKIPILDKTGKPAYLLGISEDITERKQAETQLERNLHETRVRFEVSQALAGKETEDEVLDVLIQQLNIYPHAHVAIGTFERVDGQLFCTVRRIEAFSSGIPATIPLGMRFPAAQFEASDADGVKPFVCENLMTDKHVDPYSRKMLIEGGGTTYAAFQIKTGDDLMGVILVIARISGYFDEEKQNLYRTLAEQGAVALRAARLRAALRESQQRLSLIVQQSPLAIIEWNVDFRVVSWNPAAERIFGYTREEALSRHAEDLIVPEAARPIVDQVWRALLVQKGGDYSINANFTKDGRLITCEWFNAPLVGANSQVIGIASLVQDVTDRKRAEEEIRKLNSELEQRVQQRTVALETVNRELENFAYVVSHDLKAPLRAISRLTTWLVTDYAQAFDDNGKEMAAILIGRVKRMDNLIEGILEYSRIGRIESEYAQIDLSRLVAEVIDDLAPPAQIHIRLASPLPSVVASKTRLTQVFQNLLGNAMKFMDKPQGQIIIDCTDEDPYWKFSVADNGSGIDPKYHDRIFQIFQTLQPRDELENIGIGLSIVKKIVELYGGKIWVESAMGKGSTFFFTFPKRSGQR